MGGGGGEGPIIKLGGPGPLNPHDTYLWYGTVRNSSVCMARLHVLIIWECVGKRKAIP